MENDEKVRIIEALTKGGNVNIGQLSIGDNNTLNYFSEKKGEAVRTDIDINDVAMAVKKCKMYMYAQAALTVVYAVCRDVCHWTMSQSEFERKMELIGEKCPPGTIANTIRHNPFMRDHISKWASLGAKEDVLKLRDELQKTIINIPLNPSKT